MAKGELLRISARNQRPVMRTVSNSIPLRGVITQTINREHFQPRGSSKRFGAQPHRVALTFDDGPDKNMDTSDS